MLAWYWAVTITILLAMVTHISRSTSSEHQWLFHVFFRRSFQAFYRYFSIFRWQHSVAAISTFHYYLITTLQCFGKLLPQLICNLLYFLRCGTFRSHICFYILSGMKYTKACHKFHHNVLQSACLKPGFSLALHFPALYPEVLYFWLLSWFRLMHPVFFHLKRWLLLTFSSSSKRNHLHSRYHPIWKHVFTDICPK